MGMSANQARLLFISSRINDIELKSQQIANQKMRLASDSEKVANDYTAALNKTMLVVNDPLNKNQQQQLTYQSVMSPMGSMSGMYNVQTADGKVVVSSTIANAFEKSRNLTEFLANLSIQKSEKTIATEQYNQALAENREANANMSTFLNTYGLSVSNGQLVFPRWSETVTTNTTDSTSSSGVGTTDNSSSVSTNDTSSSGVGTTDSSSSSVGTSDTSSSSSSSSGVRRAAARVMTYETNYSGGGGGGGGTTVVTGGSGTSGNRGGVTTVDGSSSGGSVGTTDSSSSSSGVGTTDQTSSGGSVGTTENTSSSSGSSNTGGGTQTTVVWHERYTNTQKTQLNSQYQQLKAIVDSTAVKLNAASNAVKNASSYTDPLVGNETYYTNLYNQMVNSGYQAYAQNALNNTEYLQYQLESGSWYLGKKDETGQYNKTSLSSETMISSVSDNRDLARAEAEYNEKTLKINNKEKKLDMQMKQLDTEHSALSTEYDSMKSLIGDNIDKTFNLFS